MNRRRLCEQLCEKCYTYFCECKRKSFKHIHHYIMNEKIGEGSNSVVYKSLSLVNRKDVALKKIQLDKEEGVPITAIPKISIMRELKHPNIVSLTNIYMVDNILYLVFEFLPINLKHYIDSLHHDKRLIETQLVKSYLHQITQGIEYCHERGIMHRELKPQNVLIDIDNNGVIKLADFGLARDFDIRVYTLGVETQWYHAPEVLLGATSFSCAIDIWSIGCIFSEMVTCLPLFKGHSDSEINQLFKIFSILSTPTEQTWPGVSHLPRYNSSFPTFPDNNLKDSVNELDPLGFDLLQKMLVYIPSQRINAKTILKHPYFDDLDKSLLPAPLVE